MTEAARPRLAERTLRLRVVATTVIALLASTLVVASPARNAQAATGPEWLPFKGTFVNAVGCTWNTGCAGGYHGYPAIDFMVPYGTPVYATGDGTLTGATGCTPNGGPVNCGPDNFGNAVKIAHPSGRDSWYAHLASVARQNGAVRTGDLIGYTGNSGKSYGTHLHYEERPAGGAWGSQVDPGAMAATHDRRAASYPSILGYSSWNQVPCGVQTGEACAARHSLRNDSYAVQTVPYVVTRQGSVLHGKAGLNDAWIRLADWAATGPKVAGNRVFFLDSSRRLWGKDGLNGTWFALADGVTAYDASPTAVVIRQGTVLRGKAGLNDAWIRLADWAATGPKLAGNRVFFLDSSRRLWGKDGLNGTWFALADGVTAYDAS